MRWNALWGVSVLGHIQGVQITSLEALLETAAVVVHGGVDAMMTADKKTEME
jgi:hypothetical protein